MLRLKAILNLTGKAAVHSNEIGHCTRYLPTLSVIHSVIGSNVKDLPNLQITRNTSFFNKLPASELWKGVTSVSNAGKKRGRGRGVGKKIAKDLNRGQIIGVGRANIVWPGLSAPVLRGRELIQQQKLPEDPEHMKKLIKIRDEMGNFRPLRLNPIERGWSGAKLPGRSIGPPDPVGEDTFDGFDTKILEFKTVINMKGNFGRKRRLSCFAVTGNKRGLAGFALGKAVDGKAAIKAAKNRAGQKLVYFNLYNNHTIHHDFFSQFGKTKVFVSKKPEGYGLVCHRAIKTICEVVGIKDLHAKVEGSTNLQHIVKAFFIGLLQQKTHETLAEEKRLHLVEFKKENEYYPQVVASPTVCRKNEEILPNETLDLTQYALGDKIVLKKKKFPPFYTKLPSWEITMKKMENRRNHDKVRIQLLAEYGEIRSFLTDTYPECSLMKPKKAEDTAEQ
ncbi:small ribosomal subunit protein uS5m [Anabrus simplex]|uniref:small ribosomal subunit protein uS5m n=1 Tax=Anabrus simplex TaxID=316456 RepID=UPI0035A3D45F